MKLLLSLLSTTLAIPVLAEPLEIRSGEHDNFSRLVVRIEEGMQWSVRPIESGGLLVVEGQTDGFDVDDIFARIPRSRLNDALSDGDTLSLDFQCDCHVDAFLWRSDRLVIDIVDGPSADWLQVSAEDVGEMVPPVAVAIPDPFPEANTISEVMETSSESREAQTPSLTRDIAEMERAILEGLARAASQGYLEPSGDFAVASSEEQMDEPASSEPIGLPDPPAVPQQPGVGVSTALDRSLSVIETALQQGLSSNCLPDDFYNVLDWADDTPFHEQASKLIVDLEGEFGQASERAQIRLAKFYVHFGFGAEARQILEMSDIQSQERRLIYELAGIVDDRSDPSQLIAAQRACETAGAFWGLLADPSIVPDQDRNLLLQTFFNLPQPLQGYLAPRFANQLLEINEVDAAEQVLRGLGGHDVLMTHDLRVSEVAISKEQEDLTTARAQLAEEADDNARTTPESVIDLIELTLSLGGLPTEAELVLAGALQQEFRFDPVAEKLELAQARGWHARGLYDRALDLLSDRTDEGAVTEIDRIYETLAKDLEDSAFLEMAFETLPSTLSAKTENQIANRLLSLGFPVRSLDVMRATPQQQAAAERRFIRAEAALQLNDFSAVLDILQGLNTDEARALRARAYTGLGTFDAALSALRPGQGDQSDLAFRAEAWDRLSIEEDAALSDFAELVLSEQQNAEIETLSDRRDLLEQSEQTRRSVEALLSRFPGETGNP